MMMPVYQQIYETKIGEALKSKHIIAILSISFNI